MTARAEGNEIFKMICDGGVAKFSKVDYVMNVEFPIINAIRCPTVLTDMTVAFPSGEALARPIGAIFASRVSGEKSVKSATSARTKSSLAVFSIVGNLFNLTAEIASKAARRFGMSAAVGYVTGMGTEFDTTLAPGGVVGIERGFAPEANIAGEAGAAGIITSAIAKLLAWIWMAKLLFAKSANFHRGIIHQRKIRGKSGCDHQE